jgi:2-amino-4-hydroxy-6-hydroxymethyldihydropteridine diphosphokinase / dihydropteroate synthase
MIILGLGSNLGDSLKNLRLAVQRLKNTGVLHSIRVSPLYTSSALLLPNAPADWNRPYLNIALACESSLSPMELLTTLKKIEHQMGRSESTRWAPRLIDIDILAWHDEIINEPTLQVPHPELQNRPFALWPLLDLWPTWSCPHHNIQEIVTSWGSRFDGTAPLATRRLPHPVLGTRLVGILNITPDSFSDGGHYTTVPNALRQAERLLAEGAEVIDVGAESTRPGAIPLSAEEEWARLSPILSELNKLKKTAPLPWVLSVDTRHYQVAEQALTYSVDWINDVTGFSNPKMRAVVASASNQVKCVVMHNLAGIPANKQHILPITCDPWEALLSWAKQRFAELMALNIDPQRFIFDLGIGYGKSADQDYQLLDGINKTTLHKLNCPLLIGHSRKSYLNPLITSLNADKDFASALFSYHLARQHVDYLRVHNVALNAQAVALATQQRTLCLQV